MTILTIRDEELESFNRQLMERKQKVHELLAMEKYALRIQPKHVYQGAYSYIERTGKALRPVGMLLCCGAIGGAKREYLALPAAAAIEVYHTWGLVHDDIIDMDELRRGGPTVHAEFRDRAVEELRYNHNDAKRYGLAVAILAGDSLMAWSVALLCEMLNMEGIDSSVTCFLIEELVTRHIPTIVNGEMTDLYYEGVPVDSIDEDSLLEMSYMKTGSIYTLAGMTGSIIGLNKCEPDHPYVKALSEFTAKCGLAFQLIDDVLNVVGNKSITGKAVGSDIKIGKRTIPIIYSLRRATGNERLILKRSFGNALASESDIREALEVIERIGGVKYTREIASNLVREGFAQLESLPNSEYRELLRMWGRRIVDRNV